MAAGAAGAATGEVAANIIAETLYDKSPNQLSQEEKLTVSTLSQVTAGLVGGTAANSADGAIIAAKTAKDAVENNSLVPIIGNVSPDVDWTATAKAQEIKTAAEQKIIDDFEKEHPDLVKNLKTTGDVAAFLADFVPVVGDIKSFAEAEGVIDYTLAVVGMAPSADIITKPLKEAKKALKLAKSAEKAGDAAGALKHQQDAVSYINNGVYKRNRLERLLRIFMVNLMLHLQLW
ncbi:VENN motif pre-toxin domain-containing protein [Rodentibacter trehalosifermentans]|uniref:VENN motif pre-toxin domain-containing protein n=1 Tax=Rodentibacter trehalosifermentans TaxID=1908263 RepID=UPI001F604DBF|nr:VENN motif pre-toxin domain-containing protein [Rodentibacter trehalosifermentans]